MAGADNTLKWKPLKLNCIECGNEFIQNSSQNVSFCSKYCKTKNWRMLNKEKDLLHRATAQKKLLIKQKPIIELKKCRKSFINVLSKLLDKKLNEVCYLKEIKCNQCSFQFIARDNRKRFCNQCLNERGKINYNLYKNSDVYKENKKAYKRYRKALLKNAISEKFKISDIFDRDKYICQICGIYTPQNKRGSYDDDAPELDHVIPLSKGGSHTPLNVQCLCRKCNILKSDKLNYKGINLRNYHEP